MADNEVSQLAAFLEKFSLDTKNSIDHLAGSIQEEVAARKADFGSLQKMLQQQHADFR